MIVGTAGHVDHGKTALVRALTGVDTDRLAEERRRGITIELGFAPLRLPDGRTLGVVDVPGHEAFVRTMVAGAAGVDLALLVVAADEGVMPQTREHLDVLRLLGVRRLVVALSKCDLADAEWRALVRDDVAQLLAATPFAGSPLVETAVTTGQGLDALRAALAEEAHQVEALDAADLFRLPVDRAFTIRGTGTVVTGTVWSGSVGRDAVLVALPDGRRVRVRGVQIHGVPVDRAPPRARVALALASVEPEEVPRGTVLVEDAGWACSTVLRADVELLAGAPALSSRTRVRLHHATREVGARVVAGRTGGVGRPFATRIVLDAPIAARAGDRFVLRGGSRLTTIGGGVVADPQPGRARARVWPAAGLDAATRLALVLAEAGATAVERAAIAVRIGVRPSDVEALVQAAGGRLIESRAYAAAVIAGMRDRLVAMLDAEHAAAPLADGAPLQTVRSRLGVGPALAGVAVAEAIAAGLVERQDALLRRAGWRPTLATGDDVLAALLQAEVEAAAEDPPRVAELVARHGPRADALLHLLARRGDLVLVGPDRYYAPAVVDRLLERLRAGMRPDVAYSPAELRQLLGLPRRLAVPLLEHADRVGVTARRDDGRVLGGPSAGGPPRVADGTTLA
ncbi:MAG TPA: selenocysteine-specific translation elongation factor [Gemmatimonadaceae bacterium]|nr:selenocysteine-specific translation elongation factor [Gemmatimonadaceae bacterium]